MTINSTNRKAGPYIGNGTATVFSFAFKVFTAADVEVVKLNVSTTVETTLALTTDYDVTLNADQNSNPGGSITLKAGALATGFNLVITSDVQNLQPTDLTNQGGFYPDVINTALDRATIQIQQLQESVDRAALLPITSAEDSAALVADITRLASSADNLDIDANNIGSINTVATNIASVNSASTNMAAIIAAPTQAANAAASATSAATSAAAAAASAVAGLYSAVQDKSADYTIQASDNGDLFRVSTTSGTITLTLPNITSTIGDGFRVAIAKYTGDTNLVQVICQPGQLINGTSLYALDVIYEMGTFVADLETQTWFAVGGGNNVASELFDVFSGTASQTAFTLSNDPQVSNAADVYINGLYQQKSQYTLSGTTLTFNVAPPSGTNNIEVRYALPVPIGTPSDNTVSVAKLQTNSVSTVKIQDAAITAAKIAINSVDGTKINLASNAGGDIMYYNGTDWVRLSKPSFYYNQTLKHSPILSAPQWSDIGTLEVYTGPFSSFTYTPPYGVKFCRLFFYGAGGGGGSGGYQTTTATAVGGGGGGGGGAICVMDLAPISFNGFYIWTITINGGAGGTSGVGSTVNGVAGTGGGTGGTMTVTLSDGYSTSGTFTVAGGVGGGAGNTAAGAAGAGAAATVNTNANSFLYVAAGCAGGAGVVTTARGSNGATAAALLSPAGGGGGAGFAAGGTTSNAGGNSSTTWPGANRTLFLDQLAQSGGADGGNGYNGTSVPAHLWGTQAIGAGGGNSAAAINSGTGDGAAGGGYGAGGGGGGAVRQTNNSRGSNGGVGADGTFAILYW